MYTIGGWTQPLPPIPRKIREEAVSPQKFAQVLGISVTTTYRWIKRGYVRAYRVGPQIIRIPRTEIVRMRQHRIPYIESGECPEHSTVK